MSSEQLIQAESQGQASDRVSIGNSITSLRRLSSIDWRDFVERNSALERVLREDPSGVYPEMDFETRDDYRHVIEKIAKNRRLDELDVARRIVGLAREVQQSSPSPDRRKTHIGYYLIDQGFQRTEQLFRCRISTSRPSASHHIGVRLFSYIFGLIVLTGLF